MFMSKIVSNLLRRLGVGLQYSILYARRTNARTTTTSLLLHPGALSRKNKCPFAHVPIMDTCVKAKRQTIGWPSAYNHRQWTFHLWLQMCAYRINAKRPTHTTAELARFARLSSVMITRSLLRSCTRGPHRFAFRYVGDNL